MESISLLRVNQKAKGNGKKDNKTSKVQLAHKHHAPERMSSQ